MCVCVGLSCVGVKRGDVMQMRLVIESGMCCVVARGVFCVRLCGMVIDVLIGNCFSAQANGNLRRNESVGSILTEFRCVCTKQWLTL